MLARNNRLRQSRDINRVYSRGRFGRASGLSVKALTNHLVFSRAVVIVGKKVSKRAVLRNLLRRRAAAQLLNTWKTVAPGYDIVITVHEDLSAITPSELAHRLSGGLHRAGVLLKSSSIPK